MAFIVLASFNMAAQSIGVIGNFVYIVDGDTTPTTADFTDFGNTTSRNFYIDNNEFTGNPWLNVSSITLSNSVDFTVTNNPTPFSIRKNDPWPLFTITLNTLTAGTYTSTVTIASDANNDGTDNVWTYTIRAVRASEINIQSNATTIVDGDITPTTGDNTDFGSTTVGTPVTKTFTIQNTGNAALSLTDASPYVAISGANASDFSVTAIPAASIASSGSTTFNIRFNPASAGVKNATLSIANNDSDENPYDFSIRGTAVTPIPEIKILGGAVPTEIVDGDTTPSSADYTDFGTINSGTTLQHTFTIDNTAGTGDLTISSITLSNTTDFAITGTTYSSPVTAGGTTTFSITYTATLNGTDTCTVTVNNDDADESVYDFVIQGTTLQLFYDSDNDGVFDNVDIDDDNDGILDTDEEADCRNSLLSNSVNYKFLEETFGAGATRTTINTSYSATTSYCYEDGTASCPSLGGIDLNDGEYTVYHKAGNGDGTNQTPNNEVASWADGIWYTGEDHTAGDTDGRMAMFNASYDPGTFYTAQISGALSNIPITYSFWVINLDRSDAPNIGTRLRPDILVEFRDMSDTVLASITTGPIAPTTAGNTAGDWYEFTADLSLGVSEFKVIFINNETGGLGNDLAIDDITIKQTLCDFDNDGIADLFDLDSDNDGIPDVVEAGLGNLSNGTGKIDIAWVDTNGNGMHDAAEGNTPLDSDGDGSPNYQDLDSDNDGIFDVDESGTGNSADANFQNGDGDINGDGVGDGPESELFRDKDVDGNGIIEYYGDGILDIYDYHSSANNYTNAYGNTNQGNPYAATNYVKDSDSDGIPDYIDTMSNGTTYDIAGTLYASLDANNDGVIDDTVDTDGDGILDLFDTNDNLFGSPRDLNRKLHLYFDGRNDYGEDINLINAWGDATLMAWIKIDPSATGDQIIVGQDSFYLQLNADKSINATANGYTITNGTALNTNQWMHIAATYSNSESLFTLYINGAEITSTAISGALPADASNLTLGRQPNTNANFFNGYLDEVRVFSKALTSNELQKMVYQEIEDNSTIVRGTVVPRDVTDFVDESTITPLNWSNLSRYYRMDAYKDDIIDDLTTPTIDVGTGAKIYNTKLIDVQTAPLPFVTQSSGSLEAAVDIPADGVNGNDAVDYDWSIVKVEHNNVTYNASQNHLALFINELDAGSNPIEFSVLNDSELNVSWYLQLDGSIDLEGESQLIQGLDSDLSVGTSGKIYRDQQGTADTYTYNYWSSPVGSTDEGTNNYSYTLPQVLLDGTQNINFLTSGYDGTNTSPIGIADYWIWKFANQTDDEYSDWQHIRSTGTLYAGEGFTMKGPGSGGISDNQNYVFSGKPNNGDINLTINPGNDYLVGNPYPSAIHAHKFITQNSTSITGALYFWEHWGGGSHNLGEYQGGYHVLNLSGSSTSATQGTNDPDVGMGGVPLKSPGNFIAVSQGFFVVASATGGTINFNNSQRFFKKENGTSSTFVGMNNETAKNTSTTNDTNQNNDEEVDTRLKLRIGFNSVNAIRRQLLTTVDTNATANIDWGYDAEHNENQIDDMFWLIDEQRFVIQGTNDINEETILPLGIYTNSEGINSIVLDKLEFAPEELNVYVHDKKLDIYHDIKESPYDIYLPAGEYLDRFAITFSNNEALITNEIENDLVNKLDVHYSNANESIVLINPTAEIIQSIEVINVLGQNLQTLQLSTKETFKEIKIKNLSSGTYILKLNTQNGTTSKKVLVN